MWGSSFYSILLYEYNVFGIFEGYQNNSNLFYCLKEHQKKKKN